MARIGAGREVRRAARIRLGGWHVFCRLWRAEKSISPGPLDVGGAESVPLKLVSRTENGKVGKKRRCIASALAFAQ